jgi:hypothetical protein
VNEPIPARGRWGALAGLLAAIAITTAMDASGLFALSALPLLPLTLTFWYLQRFSRREVGCAWGRWRHYLLATLHPALVLGAVALVATAAGALDLSRTDWRQTWLRAALVAAATFPAAILTEEGFFRGWLWASLRRSGATPSGAWLRSSVAFALWHLPAVSLATGFDLPAAQIPLFLVNAAAMGAIWGLLRWISGSIVVASLGHGLWNGGAYVFFGFGTKAGALGIRETALYGPETGLLGLALNLLFAFALWRWWRKSGATPGGAVG